MFKKNRSHSSSFSSRRVPEGVSPFSSQGLPEQEPHTKHLRCDGFSFSLLSRVLVGKAREPGMLEHEPGNGGHCVGAGNASGGGGRKGTGDA